MTDLNADAKRRGLAVLGGFRIEAADRARFGLPDHAGSLLLLGWPAPDHWTTFTASAEFRDGAANPLDRWTRRVVDALAASRGGVALYPFGGPPYHPFQAFALRAGIARPSPIGLLIHPVYGLWHSYRAALIVDEAVPLAIGDAGHPCDACADKPCLSACPVGAYTTRGFAVEDCRTYVRSHADDCLVRGCHARDACPMGREYRYSGEQVGFHQRSFAGLGR